MLQVGAIPGRITLCADTCKHSARLYASSYELEVVRSGRIIHYQNFQRVLTSAGVMWLHQVADAYSSKVDRLFSFISHQCQVLGRLPRILNVLAGRTAQQWEARGAAPVREVIPSIHLPGLNRD